MTIDDATPVLDRATLDALRQLNEPGQPDVLQEVLTLFLNDAPTRLAGIESALLAGDAMALERAAHAMKGAAGAIGALPLQNACRELELMGRAQALDGARAGAERVRGEYQRVQEAIRQLL